MQYIIIKTKPYEKSVQSFLHTQPISLCKQREAFKLSFSRNPFAQELQTHALYQKNNTVIFSCYITKKVRLIWLFIKPDIIIPYRIITDHDYHKIQQIYPAILALADYY